jgi:polyisoprenyl-teichoic acid--peptidoglycan teichoic acid transferase
MKLFGDSHKKSKKESKERIPAPKDKSRRKKNYPAGEEIQEEYLDEEQEEYDDYDQSEYEEPAEDSYEDGEYDSDEYDEYDDDEAYDDEYDEEYDEYDEDEYEDEEDDDEEPRRMSLRKKILIGVIVFLVVLLGGVGLFINYLLDLINYQAANSDYFATVSTVEELPQETAENSYLEQLDEEDKKDELEATASELEQWNEHIEDVTSDSSSYTIPISDDVYNILLIGSDTRVSGDVGRSDAMILVSINQKTETIYLTSFLRDCYVNIPGYGNTRLNHAFAYGGPDLLEKTLEQNFKVHVDRYVAVDFFSFMDVIDTLGGVYINVTEDEQKVTNNYIWSMNKLMGEEWSNDYLWSSGWQKLNGKQALCYARNRYTGNDYERTARQRTIINQIISGAMQASPATLVDLAQVILPQVTTDMSKSEILAYAANVAAYLGYDIQQQQIPASGTYSGATISGMSVISLDLDANIKYLQGTIYAGTEYGDNE